MNKPMLRMCWLAAWALGSACGPLSDRERADAFFAEANFARALDHYLLVEDADVAHRIAACRKLQDLDFEFVLVSPNAEVSDRPYRLGLYEVTQAQWEGVVGANPSRLKAPALPVDSVSWEEVQAFIGELNRWAGGPYFRLPTEAEWEFACRAGTTTRWFFGDDEGLLGEYAWYADNAGQQARPVGLKKPNPWGLYDMYGNVWEWCADAYVSDRNTAAIDRKNRALSVKAQTMDQIDEQRVNRGGSWSSMPRYTTSSFRGKHIEDKRAINLGFRLLFDGEAGRSR